MNKLDRRFVPFIGEHRPERVAVVCVGNELRGDDGFAAAVASELAGSMQTDDNTLIIDTGPVPENYLGPIVSFAPDLILFVDVAEMGKRPGALEMVPAGQVRTGGLTTHDFPLQQVTAYLQAECRARVYLLACQPRATRFGRKLSPEVRDAARQAANWLRSWLRPGSDARKRESEEADGDGQEGAHHR